MIRQAEEGELNAVWWNEKLAELKPLTPSSQISLVVNFLKNKRASDKWLGTEIALKRIDLEIRKWIADDRREDREVGDGYRVFLARTVSDVLGRAQRGELAINDKQAKSLLAVLENLGLSSLVPKGMTFGAAAQKEEKEAATKGSKKPAKAGGKKEKVVEGKEGKEEKDGVKLTFSFVSLTKGGKTIYDYMRVIEEPIEFQLRVSC